MRDDTESPKAQPQPDPDRSVEVDAVLAEFGGDARKAIAALLHDIEALAADRSSTVSFGYVRGFKWAGRKH